MAPKLGSRDPVFASPPEIRKDRLHDECCGIAKHVSAQDHENASIVSQRTSGVETTVPGLEERFGKMGTHGILGSGLESVHAAVGRSDPSRALLAGFRLASIMKKYGGSEKPSRLSFGSLRSALTATPLHRAVLTIDARL